MGEPMETLVPAGPPSPRETIIQDGILPEFRRHQVKTMHLKGLLKDLQDAVNSQNSKRTMTNDQFERLIEMMSDGDLKARRILGHLNAYLISCGVWGEMHVAILAGLYAQGFQGLEMVKAFEDNDFSIDATCHKAIYSLIQSQFPFIEDPKDPAAPVDGEPS